MKVLGLISGTSHDGIDAAVLDFRLDGAMLTGALLWTAGTPYPPALRQRLVNALPPASTTLAEVCELDTLVGQAFGAAAREAARAVHGLDLVCSHGQTVYHWVADQRVLGTLQIGQPAWIAECADAPVLSDIRIRDIVLGGQGAPLVSFLDAMLLSPLAPPAAALNLGGISNATVLSATGPPLAYDIGPANALIDAVVTAHSAHEAGFDMDGRIASAGRVDEELLRVLLREPYYARRGPRSTGKELFNLAYVERAIDAADVRPRVPDLIATLTELTVRTVADDLGRAGITTLVASGGGVRNPVIMNGIRASLPGVRVILSDELGAPADAKEAILCALIGWYSAHGLPCTVPSSTGAREPGILGSFTPGPRGLRLPPRPQRTPVALTLEARQHLPTDML